MSCHSVAVQAKQIRIHILKRNNTKHTVQTIQNTVNTSTHITKTLTHTHTHTLQNPHIHTPTHYKTHTYTHPHITKQVKTTTVQDVPKLNSHSTIKGPQYKVTLMFMVLLSPRALQ